MKIAVRQRYIDSNPVQVVEKPKGRSRYQESAKRLDATVFKDNGDNLVSFSKEEKGGIR